MIDAKSNTYSFILLPFEYSNCLYIEKFNNVDDIKLVRMNLLMTGILIKGNSKFSLKYSNGPFKNSDCRLKDLKELKKFGIDKNSFLKLTKPLTGLE